MGIEVMERGRGEPVLLLHSSLASGAQWRALAERLADRFHVLAPDLCGYGGSDVFQEPGAFRLAHEASRLVPLLRRFDAPLHVVGHSYGGAVALHLARVAGLRLRSLALYEPVAFHVLRGGDGADLRALAEIEAVAAATVRAVATGNRAAGAAHFIDYWSGPGAWNALPASRQDALAARLPKVPLDFEAGLHEPASAADFAGVHVPSLLMLGEHSPAPAHRIARRLARALPAARLSIVHGAGHMGPLTHRDEVNEQIVAHLATDWRASPCRPIPTPPPAMPSASRRPSASAGTSTAT